VRAKGEFLATISHELRSPLQTITSALDMLQRRTTGPEQAEFINRIQRATDALGAQLRDLLTLARGEAGKLEMLPEAFEVCTLVSDLAEEHREAGQGKGLQFRVEVPQEPIFAVADPARLSQMLNNLVSNAVKYTNHGWVAVTLEPFDAMKGRLCFRVEDSGPGIPQKFLPTVFAPFRRFGALDRTTESTGIGLSIVQTLANNLGATISVDSREGEGTAFRVEIPATLVSNDTPAAIGPRVMRLLIVDDRKDILDGLESIAKELGYAADVAESAPVAANLLAAKQYDVVLIDLDMPIKRGKDLASETKRGGGINSETALVAISAADGQEVGRAWPFDGFLEKPISIRALRRAVEDRCPKPPPQA